MRTRTSFCAHGFLIPGKPQPWLAAELKASPFCLKCWDEHGAAFIAHGYARIEREDPLQYGFFDVIHAVLRAHAWYRNQERYEDLESELRVHLLAKREEIERTIHEQPDNARPYVRRVLANKLTDLQRGLAERAEQKTVSYDDAAAVVEGSDRPIHEDESGIAAKIVNAVAAVSCEDTAVERQGNDPADLGEIEDKIAAELIKTEELAVTRQASSPTTPKARADERARLLRGAIQEQAHRIDALQALTQEEERREINVAHRDLMAAIDRLPSDEQNVIRLRFFDGGGVLLGRPRSRRDILLELHRNGNRSGWSEWDLRRLEQQAVLRLRSQVRLPAVFKNRD